MLSAPWSSGWPDLGYDGQVRYGCFRVSIYTPACANWITDVDVSASGDTLSGARFYSR